MLEYHKACGADATIAVIEVPFKEASRFGIMNTDETGRIMEFEEKPGAAQEQSGFYGYIYLRLEASAENADGGYERPGFQP